MQHEDLELGIRVIHDQLGRCLQENVALKGVIAALLSQSNLTDEEIEKWIRCAATNPVGTASPEDAIAAAEFVIKETATEREQNQGAGA